MDRKQRESERESESAGEGQVCRIDLISGENFQNKTTYTRKNKHFSGAKFTVFS